jgi:hypothetical protein
LNAEAAGDGCCARALAVNETNNQTALSSALVIDDLVAGFRLFGP